MGRALGLSPDVVAARLKSMGIVTRCPTCSGQWEEWNDGGEYMRVEPRPLLEPVRKTLTCERGHCFPVDLLEAPGA